MVVMPSVSHGKVVLLLTLVVSQTLRTSSSSSSVHERVVLGLALPGSAAPRHQTGDWEEGRWHCVLSLRHMHVFCSDSTTLTMCGDGDVATPYHSMNVARG